MHSVFNYMHNALLSTSVCHRRCSNGMSCQYYPATNITPHPTFRTVYICKCLALCCSEREAGSHSAAVTATKALCTEKVHVLGSVRLGVIPMCLPRSPPLIAFDFVTYVQAHPVPSAISVFVVAFARACNEC